MDGLGNYIICIGSIEQVLEINNNSTALGYTYTKRRLKKPPEMSTNSRTPAG